MRGEKEAEDLSIPQFIMGNVRLQANKLDELAADIRHQEYWKCSIFLLYGDIAKQKYHTSAWKSRAVRRQEAFI